jgi:hypothetical protein
MEVVKVAIDMVVIGFLLEMLKIMSGRCSSDLENRQRKDSFSVGGARASTRRDRI